MSRDRRLLASTVLLVCLTLGLVGLGPASAPALAGVDATGGISGTVTGPDGAPLAEALVAAYPVKCASGCDPYGAMTDSEGHYALTGLPPAAYDLMFQKPRAYLAEFYDNVVEQRNATAVVVTAGSTVTGRDAQLEHGGHLTGRVVGRGGRPLQGITVTTYHREHGAWEYVGDATTASNGTYDVGRGVGLLSGTYRLRFTDDSEPGYVTEYYGGSWNLRSASDIVMGADETVSGLDTRLAWPHKLRSVKAPKVTGKPRAGATLRLFPGAWSPSKVTVEILGWYADDLYHPLSSERHAKIRLVGQALARARGKFVKVRFQVSRRGYITVDRTMTLRGGVVTG